MIDLLCSHCDEEMPESVLDRVYMSMRRSESLTQIVTMRLWPFYINHRNRASDNRFRLH